MVANLPSVLITDDDLGFRETLRSIIEPEGFHTLLASDGEEALSVVQAEPVHLVLIDMHMPKLTGLETLREMRQMQVVLPCILMSAEADETLVEQALEADAFSVLKKPMSRQTVTDTLRSALRFAYRRRFEE